MSFGGDANYHRDSARRLLANRGITKMDAILEHLESAAVAAVMHRLRTRLETMTVEGPARAALEQLLREEA